MRNSNTFLMGAQSYVIMSLYGMETSVNKCSLYECVHTVVTAHVYLCAEEIFPPVDSSLEIAYVKSGRQPTYAAVVNHTHKRVCTVERQSKECFENQSK